jgi:hypothetical protein
MTTPQQPTPTERAEQLRQIVLRGAYFLTPTELHALEEAARLLETL